MSPIIINDPVVATTVEGTVTDKTTSLPISGVEVKIVKESQIFCSALTDINGKYSLKKSLLGDYTVKVSKQGYEPAEHSRYFRYRKEYTVDFSLEPVGYIPPDNIKPPPCPVLLYPVPPVTSEGTLRIFGKKKENTSVWINAEEVVPLSRPPFWSYMLNLAEGENHFSISVKDSAGRQSLSLERTIIYDKLYASRAREVASKDGKAKIIIPEGALSEEVDIEVLTLDNSYLEGLIHEDDALLSIVECKPYGTEFNKSVTLVYILDEPQTPGTQIKLGLYQNDKINITAASEVETDRRTVRFSLDHFSTYAAIKNLISDSGAPIGAGVQIPLPDMFTGSFSQAVPIAVPSARAGMQPNISLTYRSSNPNSWTGVGFSLNPGHITRSTRLGPPSYNDKQDTFYFISDSGTTELINLRDNLYQSKIESSFTQFFKESPDCWKAVSKDGSVLYFGQTSSSKETSPKGTFSWYVTKAMDTNSNYIEYQYTKDQGKTYLSRIDYAGNEKQGIRPTNTVNFFLESRQDVSSSYITANRIATAKRLKEIEIKANSKLVWKYKLEYALSPDTNRSLLKQIRQFAYDNKELPVQSFEYQRAE